MLRETDQGTILPVKVIPKAHKSEIVGWENGELKVRVRAVPEKGEANSELIKLIAKVLEIPQSQITIVAGLASRHKRLEISGLRENDILAKLPGVPKRT